MSTTTEFTGEIRYRPLMLIALYSPHGNYDAKFLANYAYINIVDPFTRSPGIGNVQVFRAGNTRWRLWVKPDQLAKLGITVPEIISAIRRRTPVNPAGRRVANLHPRPGIYLFGPCARPSLSRRKQFGQISFARRPDGGMVRVRDVARTELGSQDYSVLAASTDNQARLSLHISCLVRTLSTRRQKSRS